MMHGPVEEEEEEERVWLDGWTLHTHAIKFIDMVITYLQNGVIKKVLIDNAR